MRFLRLILAGLIAVTVLAAGMLAAAVVVLTGMAAYAVQLFRGKTGPSRSNRPPAPDRRAPGRTDDVIDV